MKEKIKKYKWYIVMTSVFSAIIIFVITFFSIFSIITVSGFSMFPTLDNGQVVLVNKVVSDYKYRDIVVLNFNDELIIKRLIGLPGDKIQFLNNKIIRNGEVLTEPYYENFEGPDSNGEIEVPTNNFFVLGDNINNSTDSRFIGFFPKKDVYGVWK